MKIAVLGGGNGSYAAAADLSEQGHSVGFWRRNLSAFADWAADGSAALSIQDYRGDREVTIDRPTTDMAAALAGAELIVIPTPAFAQEDLAKRMAPELRDGQVLFLPPGTFGSYVMARVLRDNGCTADIAIAETGTLPYLARKHGATTIAITTRATRLPTGVFPQRLADHGMATLARAYPAIEPVEDGLSAALMNAGPIIHPPLIMMNAGPIEHFDHWDIHHEGTQPSIRRVTDQLDGERVAVREALGYAAPHFPLADHYAAGGDEWMYGNLAHEKLIDSGDWREHLDLLQHRYMIEDVKYGLAFLVSVADWAGVDCPLARGLLAIGSTITGEDYSVTGRTLGNLQLASLSRAAMTKLLHDGLS